MPETPCKKAKVTKTGRSQSEKKKKKKTCADHSHMMLAEMKGMPVVAAVKAISSPASDVAVAVAAMDRRVVHATCWWWRWGAHERASVVCAMLQARLK
jgi:hypothetical protein